MLFSNFVVRNFLDDIHISTTILAISIDEFKKLTYHYKPFNFLQHATNIIKWPVFCWMGR